MKYLSYLFSLFMLLVVGCSTEEATENERVNASFLDSIGGSVSAQQWWRTAVRLKVNVVTDNQVLLLLVGNQNGRSFLYDRKEVSSSGSVIMTAPQGQGSTLSLLASYKGKTTTQEITLSGKPEDVVNLNLTSTRSAQTRAVHPASLSGRSIRGDAQYHQFTDSQLNEFFEMMSLNEERADAKNVLNLNCNYELESNGPFYITWATGKEAEQRSRILGYYYHSPYTYDDIRYVDLSETHKWDYIDGLAKVQYQISITDEVDGYRFVPNTWYDANFDMHDTYGSTKVNNNDRLGDNNYNAQAVYDRYLTNISALRGISFKIDVPEGMRIGFYLRADEEPYPAQWDLVQSVNIRPYVTNRQYFMGTCFSAEFLNVEGNGKGTHRSFIEPYDEIYWMGMEDLVEGGDHDCNDVIFGVVADMKIWMPTIVDPRLKDPEPVDPDPQDPEPPSVDVDADPFPWTIAYEDVYRNADFDFNDAVIKVVPDYENELCCVTVMAAGSTSRMYLHYDGPDGDQNLGEVHELFGKNRKQDYINTQGALASTPFTSVDCVPWPSTYTMAEDAKRFYIEVQRGTCDDCSDVITLAHEPGKMPEAVLVAGEWQWPLEGTHISSAYDDFPKWAQDVTRTRFWEWYKTPNYDTFVTY
jgi:hypothetical protein